MKSDLPSHIEAPSVGTSGNFVGMQRRSTPASKQSGQSTTIGFNTNQSKEPGFTVDKQRGQGFTQTAAGTGVNGKVQGLGNVPVPKPPAGSVVTNRPMAAPSVRFDTRKPAGEADSPSVTQVDQANLKVNGCTFRGKNSTILSAFLFNRCQLLTQLHSEWPKLEVLAILSAIGLKERI